MEGKLAKVSKLPDDVVLKNKLVIYFTIKDEIEDAIAYPLDVYDECSIGDEVYIYEMESVLGFSFMYNKVRLEDHTRLKLGDSEIDIKKDIITFNDGNNGGLLNRLQFDKLITAIQEDFVVAQSGANLTSWIASEYPNLYDNKVKH